jgi:glucose/arabinose dehydrogenase
MRRTATIFSMVILLCGMALAQKNPTVPQPRADALPAPGTPQPSRGREVPKPPAVMPTAPAGFTVSIYADDIREPRMMVYAPNGDLFVSSPAGNNLTVFRDTNNDGQFEARGVYADKAMFPAPAAPPAAEGPKLTGPQTVNGPSPGANAPPCTMPPPFNNRGPGGIEAPFGMAFQGGYLYVGNTGSIVRFKYMNGDLKATAAPEKLLDLPVGGHSTRNIVFNRAGTKMYVTVGSRSNNDAGEDCRRAAVLEFNPDGSGYRIYASGIRNPVGLTLQPGTDTLWVAMNERDNLGDNLVPDFATALKDGGFYGWPYSYIGSHYDPRYVGSMPELVKRAIVPDVLIPAHSAALGMAFYTGTSFPQKYRGGAFVALHGSWNRSTAVGYRVIYIPMTNGKPGPIEDFLTGFLSQDGSEGEGISRWGRPVGVTVARDGSLLVSDDGGNRIWKVSAK